MAKHGSREAKISCSKSQIVGANICCESVVKQVIQASCETSSLRHVCNKSWTSGKCTSQTINILTTNEATLGSLCSDSYYHPMRLCKCVQASKHLQRKTFWWQFVIIPINFCNYLLPNVHKNCGLIGSNRELA